MTSTASNLSEFQVILAKAEPGATIDLAPGTWPMLAARRRVVEGPQIILRALERRKTEITFADLNYWGGFHFQGLRFAKPTGVLFDMGSTQDLTWTDCEFTTAPTSQQIVTPGGETIILPGHTIWDPWETQVRTTSIRNAKRIKFLNCDFWGLRQALAIRGSEDVVVSKCRLHHMREGIQVEGSSRVAIHDNEFTAFWPRYHMRAKEHSDDIQFYTRNEKRGNRQCSIIGNRFFMDGKRSVQVIFIRAENYENGKFPEGYHEDIEVSRNLIYNSAKWAIAMSSVRNAKVNENIVIASQHVLSGWPKGQDGGRTSVALWPSISLLKDVTGECRNNFAPAFYFDKRVLQSNNRKGWPLA